MCGLHVWRPFGHNFCNNNLAHLHGQLHQHNPAQAVSGHLVFFYVHCSAHLGMSCCIVKTQFVCLWWRNIILFMCASPDWWCILYFFLRGFRGILSMAWWVLKLGNKWKHKKLVTDLSLTYSWLTVIIQDLSFVLFGREISVN